MADEKWYASPGNQAGQYIGDDTAAKVGFYGVAPVAQRAGAAQATSLVGTASSADVTSDHKAALIEVMNTLTALGIWKGSA
jgi:hypothetical protein